MKTELHTIEKTTIEKFADKHGLVMEVHERKRPLGDLARFYAHFKGVEVKKQPCFLLGEFGNGSTPKNAIADYADKISGELLVVDAMAPDRREILVPQLVSGALGGLAVE